MPSTKKPKVIVNCAEYKMSIEVMELFDIGKWNEYYTVNRMKTFSQFLAGIKYGLLKLVGDTDMLTMIERPWLTEKNMLEQIKETGEYSTDLDGVVIDVEYGNHIYIAVQAATR